MKGGGVGCRSTLLQSPSLSFSLPQFWSLFSFILPCVDGVVSLFFVSGAGAVVVLALLLWVWPLYGVCCYRCAISKLQEKEGEEVLREKDTYGEEEESTGRHVAK
ncbi:hypothetical protein Tco_1509043 [Tanacetum coccineum]